MLRYKNLTIYVEENNPKIIIKFKNYFHFFILHLSHLFSDLKFENQPTLSWAILQTWVYIIYWKFVFNSAPGMLKECKISVSVWRVLKISDSLEDFENTVNILKQLKYNVSVTFLHLTLVKYSIIFHKTKKGFNILCFAQFNEDYNTMSSLLWESFPDWLLLGPGEQVPHQLLLFTQVLDVHHGLCAIF